MAVVEQNYVTFEEIAAAAAAAAEKESGRDGTGHKTGPENGRNKYRRKKEERKTQGGGGGGVDEHYRVCVFLALICVFVHS